MADLTLASRMRTLAWSGEQKEKLLDHAAKLEALSLGVSTPENILGTWARARRFWCDLTGEPLI